MSYTLVFASKNHPVQNALVKNKKSSKVRQDRETLASAFAYFLSTSAKGLFLGSRLDTGLCPQAVLRFGRYFLIS